MPNYFAKNHNDYISSFIKSGQSRVLNSELFVFAATSKGFIFPIWLLIKQYLDNSENLNYIGLIKPLRSSSTSFEYLLLDNKGTIEGITEHLAG